MPKILDRKQLKNMPPWWYDQMRKGRWKARTDLGWLCREILGYKDVSDGDHVSERVPKDLHKPLIDILQKFPLPSDEEFNTNDVLVDGVWHYTPLRPMMDLEGPRRTLILDSRGHLKTTVNSMAHAIQWILNYPEVAILMFMSSDTKAADVLGEIKQHFQYNPRFRDLFPEHCPQSNPGDWGTMQRFITEARPKHIVRKEPTIMTASVEKGAAGYHVDVIKFVDIVDENNIQGNGLENVRKKFDISINLLVGPRYWMDVEGTRYHFGDTYGKIIEREMDLPVEKRSYNIFVRGSYKRDVSGGEKFTPEELKRPFLLNENGERVPWWPERFPLEFLESQEKDDPWLFACTPAWAPILMSDWQEKPISEVKIGDEIIGFQNKNRTTLEKSIVLEKGSHKQQVYEITTNLGSKLYSTHDHEWYTGKKNRYRDGYAVPKVKRRVVRVYNRPTPISKNLEKDWYWLCGILDGEGYIATKKQGQITITQSEEHNPEVSEKIVHTLDKLGIKCNPYRRAARYIDGMYHKNSTMYALQGGRNLKLKFLHLGNCAKAPQLTKALWKSNRKLGKGRDCYEYIVSIEPIGKQEVYWLKTTTGNYINQGFASSNCQRLNSPNLNVEGATPFPINDQFPKKIRRSDFEENVRVAYKEICVDLAETDNPRSNYTCITVGTVSHDGRLYIEEIIHGKFLADVAVQKIFATGAKHYRHLKCIKIEKSNYLRGLQPTLMRVLDTQYRPKGMNFQFQEIQRGNRTSKADRIHKMIQPWYKRGDLLFVDDIDKLAWTRLLKEMEEFPASQTDDILDTISDFLMDKEYFGRENPRGNPYLIRRDGFGHIIDPVGIGRLFKQVQSEKFDKWIGIYDFDNPSYPESASTDPTKTDSFFVNPGFQPLR